MISVMSASRPARENGPIIPPSTGRSQPAAQSSTQRRTSPVRPEPASGIFSFSISSSVEAILPETVGFSYSDQRISEPKASASTDRSMKVTSASAGVSSARRRMQRNSSSPLRHTSEGRKCSSSNPGLVMIGIASRRGEEKIPSTNFFISHFIGTLLLRHRSFLLFYPFFPRYLLFF